MNHLLHELMPFVSHYGLWIVFIGVMIEGITMIIVTGILCYLGMLTIKEALPVAIIGAMLGDQLWYFLGKNYLDLVLQKFPFFQHKIKKLEPTIYKKGQWLAFFGRFIYGGAILFPMGLGTYRYSYLRFTFFDTLGVVVWSLTGILLGYTLGSGAEQFVGKLEKVWHFILLICLILIVVWFIKYYFLKNKQTDTFKNK